MTGSSDKPLWNGVAVLGLALAVVGVVTRPFLFVPIGAILVLWASKQTADQRITRPGIVLVTILAVVGAGIAAAGGHPLY